MRIKNSAKLRLVAGENIVMEAVGGTVSIARVVSLNETAAWLWAQFEGRDFSTDDVAVALVAEYGIEPDRARQDAALWVSRLQEEGIIS